LSVLSEIFEHKRGEVAARESRFPLSTVIDAARAAPPPLDFVGTLRSRAGNAPALIAEAKKASPSRGLLCPDFDAVRVARAYMGAGAAAISVLTDERYFQGSLGYLEAIAALEGRPPLLEKDFIYCDYQVYEARAKGADAILLIAAMLDDAAMAELHALALSLGMAALVEVHDEAEMARAAALGAELVGVNNRDLKTFSVDLATSIRLAPLAPRGAALVAESGIKTHDDALLLRGAGFHAMLVGEGLVASGDPGAAAMRLMGAGR
jgi:indole-3-glycerol phosphate synthase